jgi:hypothetical protein
MRPPFPGMDPWLEHPDRWPDVHNSLITAIRDALAPLVLPRYFVRVESRTTVLTGLDVGRVYRPGVSIHATELGAKARAPGVAVLERPEIKPYHVVLPIEEEIEEPFLAIQELPGRKLVTVVEILSPANKKTTDARKDYLDKRSDLIRSKVSLVEIDLLRAGEPMPVINPPASSDYRIMICRAGRLKSAALYVFSWTNPIPPIPIPLLPTDVEPTLDLNAVLHALIDRARYDLVIDYHRPPEPALRREDESWAATIIAGAKGEAREITAGKGNGP